LLFVLLFVLPAPGVGLLRSNGKWGEDPVRGSSGDASGGSEGGDVAGAGA
jgi:hypothetical protein